MAEKTLYLTRDTTGAGFYCIFSHNDLTKSETGNWYGKDGGPIHITYFAPNDIEKFLPHNMKLRKGEGPKAFKIISVAEEE